MRRCTRRAAKPPKVMTSPHIQTPCLPSVRRDPLRPLPPDGEGTEFVEPLLSPQLLGPPHSVSCFLFFFFFLASLRSLPSVLFALGCSHCFCGTVCKELAASFFLRLTLRVSVHRHHSLQKSLWCFTLGIITFGGPACLLFSFLVLSSLCSLPLYFFFVLFFGCVSCACALSGSACG